MNYDAPKDITKLRVNLKALINKELAEFQAATGLAPTEIRIDMLDVTVVSDPLPRYMISDLHIGFRY